MFKIIRNYDNTTFAGDNEYTTNKNGPTLLVLKVNVVKSSCKTTPVPKFNVTVLVLELF